MGCYEMKNEIMVTLDNVPSGLTGRTLRFWVQQDDETRGRFLGSLWLDNALVAISRSENLEEIASDLWEVLGRHLEIERLNQ